MGGLQLGSTQGLDRWLPVGAPLMAAPRLISPKTWFGKASKRIPSTLRCHAASTIPMQTPLNVERCRVSSSFSIQNVLPPARSVRYAGSSFEVPCAPRWMDPRRTMAAPVHRQPRQTGRVAKPQIDAICGASAGQRTRRDGPWPASESSPEYTARHMRSKRMIMPRGRLRVVRHADSRGKR